MDLGEAMEQALARVVAEVGREYPIVIGGEHTAPGLRSFSLVASTAIDGTTVRTVGVIGPTRMHYSRAITLVDGTTQAVARVLRDQN